MEYFTICINMACEKSDFLPKSGDKLLVFVASLREVFLLKKVCETIRWFSFTVRQLLSGQLIENFLLDRDNDSWWQ